MSQPIYSEKFCNVKRLEARWHLDEEAECLYRLVKNQTERFVPHCHEYYEIFLTTAGRAEHYINGETESVSPNRLIFIRKDDVHDYKNFDGAFEFVNLAFSENTLLKLFDYLGEGFPGKSLLESKMPPMVELSEKEGKWLYLRLAELNTVNFFHKAELKTKARVLLTEIFSRYFSSVRSTASEIPVWLENAYNKMKSPKNFIAGKSKFFELCGMSREHSTRSMKQYYGITPSEYVNELRLIYAANLLISSNLNAAEICYECGFQNLSWFYNEFESRYGASPAKYRKKYQR